MIWKFAENIDGAKKFLVDYVGNFHQAFDASEVYNFPCFPKQVPDLKQLVAKDSQGEAAGQVRGARRRRSTGPPTSATPATPRRRSTRSTAPGC